MAVEILLPQRGMGGAEATVAFWYREEGQFIEEGELLVDVESAKATETIVSPVTGIVSRILVAQGEEVEAGTVLAIIEPIGDRPLEGDKPAADQITPAGSEALGGKIPHSTVRRTTAKRMVESLRNSAQLTLHTEVDMTAAVDRREAIIIENSVTYTDIMVRIVATALRRHPILNAVWSDDALMVPDGVNIGVAVALDDGLVVPVIHDAGHMSLVEIHEAIGVLTEKARSGKLAAEDVSGGTFTITNLGTHGIDMFTPILNPPESAILGVGRIRRKPAVVGDAIIPRWMACLSLTFDHRVCDGAPAAAFLATVSSALEKAEF
jgi:pyruvate dehydrogenase E2 component (dihydrolipoamide acetyltransferase)